MAGRHGRFRDDLLGKEYGKWKVIGRIEKTISGQAFWMCKCECGTERAVRAGLLTRGASTNCGCVNGKPRVQGPMRGQSKEPENGAYRQMHQRCENPNAAKYHHYGARGIRVCERWSGAEGYFNFIADMGRRPTPTHTVDRFPSRHGNYSCGKCPECILKGWLFNCRWATRKEQTLNRDQTILIEYNGESLTAYDWEKKTGIPKSTIDDRIRRGWTPEQTLTVIPEKNTSPNKLLKIHEKWYTTKQAAAVVGLSVAVLRDRLKRGWSEKDALTIPVGGNRSG